MNRDDVLEMARQAGYDDPRAIGDCAIFDYLWDEFVKMKTAKGMT